MLINIMFKSGLGLADSSRVAYEYRLRNFISGIWPDKRITPVRAQDLARILPALSEYSAPTRRGIVIALLKYLGQFRGVKGKVLDKYRALIAAISDKLKESGTKMSEHDRANWVPWSELAAGPDAIWAAMKDVGPGSSAYFNMYQKYIVLLLYTALPPLRADYADTIFIGSGGAKDNGKSNVMDAKRGVFILRQYKTAKHEGPKVIDLPENLRAALRGWAKVNGTGWLLVTVNDRTPMGPNTLSKYVTDLTRALYGKKIGPTLFRKIYLSTKYPVEVDNAKKIDAEIMGHSLATQAQYYRKDMPK
ncbi:MAG: hypothetical protein ACYC3F_16645 [Gemmatimonadaceae bacterium]